MEDMGGDRKFYRVRFEQHCDDDDLRMLRVLWREQEKSTAYAYYLAAVFMALFLVYSIWYSSMTVPRDIAPWILRGKCCEIPYGLAKGTRWPILFTENDVTRLIYRVGWLPFFAMLAAVAGFTLIY